MEVRRAPVAVATSTTLSLIEKINEEHKLACSSAKAAIQHAVKCGQLLREQKRLHRGEFISWIKRNCVFAYSTAARYMKAAEQVSTGVEISSVRGLFPSGRTPRVATAAKAATSAPPTESHADAESNANAAQSSLPIEEALRMVARTAAFSNLKAEVYAQRNHVARRRIALAKAERKLADAEAALIHAAMRLQSQKKSRP
jgi:hypothetical protein